MWDLRQQEACQAVRGAYWALRCHQPFSDIHPGSRRASFTDSGEPGRAACCCVISCPLEPGCCSTETNYNWDFHSCLIPASPRCRNKTKGRELDRSRSGCRVRASIFTSRPEMTAAFPSFGFPFQVKVNHPCPLKGRVISQEAA